MTYTKHIYYEEIGNYVVSEMTKDECRDYLTRYYNDNEALDQMIEQPNMIPVMDGFVKIRRKIR